MLDRAVGDFILDCKARNLRPFTVITYERQLRQFATFCADVGAMTLADIDPRVIRSFIAHLLQRGLAPASVRTAATCTRVFLNWCATENHLDASPWRNVKMPRQDAPEPDSFTAGEVRQLLGAAGTRDRAMVLFLLDTGARLGEASLLQIRDVDMATGAVHVRRGTKARRPRTLFIGQRTRDALGDYLAAAPAPADAPLWRHHDGMTPLTRNGLQEAVKRLGRRAKVRPCAPHRFRRTFALWTLRHGIDLESLRELMGHSTDQMLRYYAKLNDDDLRKAHASHGPVDHVLGM